MSFLGKFTKRVLGLNHVAFCNPDFAEVEMGTRWFECRNLGSAYPHRQHGSKRQDGLEQYWFTQISTLMIFNQYLTDTF